MRITVCEKQKKKNVGSSIAEKHIKILGVSGYLKPTQKKINMVVIMIDTRTPRVAGWVIRRGTRNALYTRVETGQYGHLSQIWDPVIGSMLQTRSDPVTQEIQIQDRKSVV